MKKFSFICLVAVLSGLSSGRAVAADDLSLIVAPARYSVIQLMFDVIKQRPSVLVSYLGEASTPNPSLHVWNGATWMPVGLHELRELNFLQRTPSRVILIGDDALLPTAIRDGLAWMPEIMHVRELSNAAVLNDLGRVFSWSKSEWRWFAARYNLNLEDEAEPLRRRSWYDQPGPIAKGEESSYRPVPVTTWSAPADGGEGPQPILPPAVVPPSEVPAPAAQASTASDLDELIGSLEQQKALQVEDSKPKEKFPIK